MLSLEVLINGKRMARAGLGKGRISALVSWTNERGRASKGSPRAGARLTGLRAQLHGWRASKSTLERLTWLNQGDFRVGDEITLRISSEGRPDPPTERETERRRFRIRKGAEVHRCSLCGELRPLERRSGAPGINLSKQAACYQCVAVAMAMLETGSARAGRLRRVQGDDCSFCGHSGPGVVFATDTGRICQTCVESFDLAY